MDRIDEILYGMPEENLWESDSKETLDLIKILEESVKDKLISDVHVRVGKPPIVRRAGKLEAFEKFPVLTEKDTENLIYGVLKDKQKKRLEEEQSLDFSLEIKNAGRFRGNAFYYDNGKLGAVFRKIPEKIPPLSALGLPQVVEKLKYETKGLILVTGPTGSGKSTTCAALCNEILNERGIHLLTVEDPIEYRFTASKGIVTQRNLDTDFPTFSRALKDALREDPDVVFVGEMRDKETIEIALRTAESGHLVISTLHTNSAAETIYRIVDVFPEEARPQIRTLLSFVLKGIINQVLIPKKDGTGRVVASEVVFFDTALRNIVRENKMQQFLSAVQMGKKDTGSVLLNESLKELVAQGLISKEDAVLHAYDKDGLLKDLNRVRSW